jgi:hypothetical protein
VAPLNQIGQRVTNGDITVTVTAAKVLQPGFEADMTYVYRIPAAAQVRGWGFSDATDLSSGSQDWAVVRVSV